MFLFLFCRPIHNPFFALLQLLFTCLLTRYWCAFIAFVVHKGGIESHAGPAMPGNRMYANVSGIEGTVEFNSNLLVAVDVGIEDTTVLDLLPDLAIQGYADLH